MIQFISLSSVDSLTGEMVQDVREMLGRVRIIISEDVQNRRMTFHTNPRTDVPARKVLDAEDEIIRRFCNAPYCLYPDVTQYRFALVCN